MYLILQLCLLFCSLFVDFFMFLAYRKFWIQVFYDTLYSYGCVQVAWSPFLELFKHSTDEYCLDGIINKMKCHPSFTPMKFNRLCYKQQWICVLVIRSERECKNLSNLTMELHIFLSYESFKKVMIVHYHVCSNEQLSCDSWSYFNHSLTFSYSHLLISIHKIIPHQNQVCTSQ